MKYKVQILNDNKVTKIAEVSSAWDLLNEILNISYACEKHGLTIPIGYDDDRNGKEIVYTDSGYEFEFSNTMTIDDFIKQFTSIDTCGIEVKMLD